MDKLKQYLKERENVESIESEYGFATYSIHEQECYIRDIWVQPQFRQLNHATTLADCIVKIAKDKGCTFIIGTVCPAANNSTESLKVLLGYKMKLVSSKENLIIFRKEIGE